MQARGGGGGPRARSTAATTWACCRRRRWLRGSTAVVMKLCGVDGVYGLETVTTSAASGMSTDRARAQIRIDGDGGQRQRRQKSTRSVKVIRSEQLL
ncbi:hypothetical protein M0R45_027600 [Rubus argutus]|uniref:Uncharacterized protein n=1 Tax=Rubus argutus TaxID=59490 RepID=A0AAW1X2I3_RUBAR